VKEVVEGVRSRLKPSKVRIGYPTEIILGSAFSAGGLRPSPAHVAAVVPALALPTNPSEMRSVIGLFTYFFEHFGWFSARMAPLHKYARDGVMFPSPLPKDVQDAINTFKVDMVQRHLLVPYNPGQQLYIDSDASLIAAGSCIYHLSASGERRPIAYFSKKFSQAETNWAPYVREAYALAWTLEKAKHFVEAAQLTPIVFDQKPLMWRRLGAPKW